MLVCRFEEKEFWIGIPCLNFTFVVVWQLFWCGGFRFRFVLTGEDDNNCDTEGLHKAAPFLPRGPNETQFCVTYPSSFGCWVILTSGAAKLRISSPRHIKRKFRLCTQWYEFLEDKQSWFWDQKTQIPPLKFFFTVPSKIAKNVFFSSKLTKEKHKPLSAQRCTCSPYNCETSAFFRPG